MGYNYQGEEVKSLKDQVFEYFQSGLVDQAWNDEAIVFNDDLEPDVSIMVREAASLFSLDMGDDAPVWQWARDAVAWWESLGVMPGEADMLDVVPEQDHGF